ncbi:hypothetical protein [Xanthomonas albilineans]|uniref:Hypothetical membrane protein n=1 Tax=Xanthomonas albilineans (strain GPE PC73 / CFBP 7063) TaxID=380358 RepID=D2UG52_XANAP|nr:hypothetical protein [Xanthomonas albilineans]QHQ29615.1 putative membrane protein [Xanthomonas albilineans]CBA17363.1 hypothetical membrane protein [Xanthomonas albilineans GPE PC73]
MNSSPYEKDPDSKYPSTWVWIALLVAAILVQPSLIDHLIDKMDITSTDIERMLVAQAFIDKLIDKMDIKRRDTPSTWVWIVALVATILGSHFIDHLIEKLL